MLHRHEIRCHRYTFTYQYDELRNSIFTVILSQVSTTIDCGESRYISNEITLSFNSVAFCHDTIATERHDGLLHVSNISVLFSCVCRRTGRDTEEDLHKVGEQAFEKGEPDSRISESLALLFTN